MLQSTVVLYMTFISIELAADVIFYKQEVHYILCNRRCRLRNDKMARVVVFGAAGQVGVCLVETALRDGYQVTAFIRNTPLPEHLTDKV